MTEKVEPHPYRKFFDEVIKERYALIDEAFHHNPSGENWTQMEQAMWAWQAFHQLSVEGINSIIKTEKIDNWWSALIDTWKD